MTVNVTQAFQGAVSDPAQILDGEFERRARAHDASHFLLYPSSVVVPKSADEVARLLRAASQAGTSLTFRSGGTSLSGQAGTDKVLVDVRRHFNGIEILDNGARVRVEPGLTVQTVNAYLAPYGVKLGPDPASSKACTIGGVVANNSSGMACGVVENTYKTLESLVVVLPSGTVIDTGAADADQKLRATEPDIYDGLIQLRDRVVSNPASVAKIQQQFSMKNTMGYGINSFVDFHKPIDILTHLMIGSEGTLGFIASATYRTVPIRNFVRTALIVFNDLFQANSALPALVESGAATLELMDATSLRVGQSFDDTPELIKRIAVKNHSALLLEYQSTTQEELDSITEAAKSTLAQLPVDQPVQLAEDPALRVELWALRNGLYTSVAGARRMGTTALLEDVVVPVASLANTCTELSQLFDEYKYADSVIFGHAKDGNVHFMITDRFEGDEPLQRYHDFTEAMVDVVLRYNGSLKAEHGTGRVMAPFVERQWGHELYDVMVGVKKLFDPTDLLNDNVVITDDPDLHMKHMKPPVAVDPSVDRCTECGYCEPVCPARNLTLTPRQRIALRREIEYAKAEGDVARVKLLEDQYRYQGLQTCAVDGMCATHCALKINTALLVKKYRKEQMPGSVSAFWTTAAKHWEGTTSTASLAMTVAHSPLQPVVIGVNKLGRKIISEDTLPLVSKELPAGGKRRARPAPSGEITAVYLPACVNRMFGPLKGGGVQKAFEQLCAKAGINLLVPPEIDSMCCGTVWSSKQITPGYEAMKAIVLPILKKSTQNGKLYAICDASSCTEGFRHMIESDPSIDIEVIDAVEFVAKNILPVLGEYPKLESVTIHQTCSSTQMGLNPSLVSVAKAVAKKVNVPVATGCCAFAGDRGM
ncbi:MAG: FAD-binding oxidoreductase, partial [Propionibacteriaceae bacterium]|nr:FAD-binding oxidoreductase [Propionibacteriaceae bacterium]